VDVVLDEMDRDGAIREGMEGLGMTRAQVLRRGALGIGAALAGGAGLLTLAPNALAKSKATDLKVLQFALIFEHLGVAFYGQALRDGGLSGETLRFAETVYEHELAHAAFIEGAIRTAGATPAAPPAFTFGHVPSAAKTFREAAEVIEQLCVEVINGAGPLVTLPTLAAAGQLVSVEARHVSWVRQIIGVAPALAPFDAFATPAQAEKIVKSAGFVKSF
jgi:hypothetical protein